MTTERSELERAYSEANEKARKFFWALETELSLDADELGERVESFIDRHQVYAPYWIRMQRAHQVAHRRERLEDYQRSLRERIKKTRIGELIEQHFHDASTAEVAWIERRVRAEHEAYDHYYDEKFTLAEMLRQGLPGVRREMQAKPSKWRHVFWLWRVLTHVPEVVIVWAIYAGTALTSQYQVIVFSSIVIIYTRFQQWIRHSGQINLAHTNHRNEIWTDVRRRMGKPHDYGELKDIKEVRKLLTNPGAAFYVDMTAYGVLDAIAMVNLLKAVFSS